MASVKKITVDGETLYITNLVQAGSGYKDNKINLLELSSNDMQAALKPIVSVCKKITHGMRDLSPDETELTIQLSAGVDGNNLFFALANLSAEAQIAVKYVWKKNPE